MAVVFSIHRSYTPLISENANHLNPHWKFNTSQLSFHQLPRKTKHKLRCLSSKSTPESPEDEEEMESVGVKAALAVLRFYKREISPVLPRSCQYVPTCSEYSMEAYKKYGFLKGTTLTTWRLCRCNPLGGSGFDPPRWFGESKIKSQEVEKEEDQKEI